MRLYYLCSVFLFIITIRSIGQQCPIVKLSDFQKEDLPTATEKLQLKGLKKGSSDYYYGIGVPVNYVTARQLAFMEWDTSGNVEPFAGAGILMMIYANGYGVKKNLDLSIQLACANVPAAQAETEGRIEHLKDMKQNKSKDVFDICDDITSGYMMGICQSKMSESEGIDRNKKISRIIQAWLPNEKDAFIKLKIAFNDFVNTRVTMEVDLTGTARAMFESDEEDSLRDAFLTAVKLIDKCILPQYSLEDFTRTDNALNKTYSTLMKDSNYIRDTNNIGTITRSGIIKAERSWLKYENTWIEFAALKCPNIPDYAIKTYFTKQRTLQLKELIED